MGASSPSGRAQCWHPYNEGVGASLFPGVTFATNVIDALQPQHSFQFGLNYNLFFSEPKLKVVCACKQWL